MDPRDLSFVTEATQGELRNGSPQDLVTGVCTDSRTLSRGELFVALVGDRFDAHEFLNEDVGRLAGACLVESSRVGERLSGVPQILVDDSRQALGRLGARYRETFNVPVVGVTGSNGKTSTKRFLTSVLAQRFQVCSSPASFNNDIGVPLSLLGLGDSSEVAVFEVGTNHPGEIQPLAEMIRPDIGVLTSIGRSHLEFFGSVEAVAYEKGFLGQALSQDGLFVVNGDTAHLDVILPRVCARVVTVGFGSGNDWLIEPMEIRADGTVFRLRHDYLGGWKTFFLPVMGRHHLLNVSLAVAVAAELGVEADKLAAGVEACRPAEMRLEQGVFGGVTVFDDTYNANADSVTAALQTLADFPCAARRYAVLGTMGELGDFSQSAHEEVGQVAASLGIDVLVGVGEWSNAICQGALAKGIEEAVSLEGSESVESFLGSRLQAGDAVLLKASRAAALDRAAERLRDCLGASEEGRS